MREKESIDMRGYASFRPVAILKDEPPLSLSRNSQEGWTVRANTISPCHFPLKCQIRLDTVRPRFIALATFHSVAQVQYWVSYLRRMLGTIQEVMFH